MMKELRRRGGSVAVAPNELAKGAAVGVALPSDARDVDAAPHRAARYLDATLAERTRTTRVLVGGDPEFGSAAPGPRAVASGVCRSGA